MELTDLQLAEKAKGKILVMFHFSKGCMWCDRMKKPFEAYPSEVEKGTYSFGPFERGASKPALAEQLKIQSLPAFILFDNEEGKPVARDEILYQAFMSKEEIIISDPSEESQCDSCQ